MLLRALLVLLFFAFLARAVWRLISGVLQGASGGAGRPGPTRPTGPAAVKMIPCPVCGTYVVPGKALTGVSKGATVYFCSEACRARFAA